MPKGVICLNEECPLFEKILYIENPLVVSCEGCGGPIVENTARYRHLFAGSPLITHHMKSS